MQKWREAAAAAQGAMMDSMWSLAATSSSNTAEIAHASVSGSAFMLALSDPKMIDRRLGSLYDTEDWADGPDGVAMSVFQREAFLMQLALITAPQQAAKDAVAAAVEATACLTAAASEAAASTAAERFAQRERVARASEKADVAAAAARRAVLAAQTHVREQRQEARERARQAEGGSAAATANDHEDRQVERGEGGAIEEDDEGEEEVGAGNFADISWDEDALEACLELSANDAAADGLVKSTTRAEEKALMKLDPRVWTEQWDPVAALLAEMPTRRRSAATARTSTAAEAGLSGKADDADSSIINSSDSGNSSTAIESPRKRSGNSRRVLAMPSPPSFLRKRKPALDTEPAPQQQRQEASALRSDFTKNRSAGSGNGAARLSSSDDDDNDDENDIADDDTDNGDDDEEREALSARELEWIEARMADADQGTEIVSARLGRHVSVHCEDLISGMRTVQEVDSTLVAASVVAGNGRRLLQKACHNLQHGHLSLVALQRRRDRLASVKAVLRQAALLKEVEAQIEAAATSGAFDTAIVLAVEAQDALGSHAIYDHEDHHENTLAGSAEEQSVARLKVLHAMRRRVSGALPGLRRDVDKALWRLVAGRTRQKGEDEGVGGILLRSSTAVANNGHEPGFEGSNAHGRRPLGGGTCAFVGEEYAAIVRAYMHLDDLRVQAPEGEGGLMSAAAGHFDDDDEDDEDEDDDDSESEDGSGDSDATEDMSISMSTAYEAESPSGDAVYSPYGQGSSNPMEGEKEQGCDDEEDELHTLSSRQSRGHFKGAAAAGASVYGRGLDGKKQNKQWRPSSGASTAAVAALAAAERESVATAVGAALAIDGTKPSISGLGSKLERFFAFQAQRLAQLDARKRLFSPAAAAKDAAPIAALPPRSRARALLPWPARLQSWLQNASGACVAACVAGCCAEMVGLLHRYWLLQHWHRQPFASDAAGAGKEPYSLANAAAATAAAAAADASNAAGATTDGAEAVAKKAQEEIYVLGERVEAKDFGEGEEWEMGIVTALEDAGDGRLVPRVIKDGYESAYLWDAVRKLPMSEEELQAQARAEDAASLAAVEAAEADLASASDDDEDEESMELDRGQEGGGGKSSKVKSMSGATVAAREKARRLLREQKRLAPVAAALRRGRFALWRACEDQVVTLLTAMDITPADDYDDDNDNEKQGAESSPLIRPRMTPDALATISATCQLFAHIGRQFCANNDSSDQASGSSNRFGSGFSFPEGASTSNNSSGFEGSRRLEGCLRLRTKLFFAESHAKQLAHAKALAARDTWARGPYLALPPPPHETPHYGKKAHHNSSHSSHSSSKVEAWNTGLNASDVLSTVRVLTAETPGPSGGSSGSNSGSSGATDSSNSEANNGRAFLPWACSARQHAAVRRLVTSKRSQTPWPPIAERLPALRALLHRRTLAQERLWQMGHLRTSKLAASDASAEVSQFLQGALRELLTATTASCVPMTTASATADSENNEDDNDDNIEATSVAKKPVEMFVLGSIHLWGNPFSASSAEEWARSFSGKPSTEQENSQQGARRNEDTENDVGDIEEEGDGDVVPSSSSSNSNEAVVVRRLERRQFGTAWTVTEPALHVVTCTAAYGALMLHLPWVAADAHAGLGQLAKLYAYNVLTLFAPPKALKALCAPPNHLRAGGAGRSEASTGGSSRSTGMGSRSHKRSGANHKEGGSDGSGSDPEPSTGAAASSTTNKATGPAVSTPAEQLLSADARAFADLKRFAMLAAEEFAAPGTATSGGGATGASGKGNGGSGLRIYRNSTASNSAADSSSTGGSSGSGESSRPLVPRPLVEYPAAVVPVTHEGGRCGPDNLWGLCERIAAAQSLVFVLEVLLASQPQFTVLLAAPTSPTSNMSSPLAAALQQEAAHCEQALKELMPVAADIQRFLFRAVGRAVINANVLAKRVAAHPWNDEDDHETATTPAMSYTAAVASDAARAWEALCGNGNGSGADAAAATDGNNSDNWVVPIVARDAVWSEAVQAVMDALVEGFARAGPVSADARSQMADDLQAVQLSLDRVHRARPRRGKVYVDAYLKAFYYGEDDLVRWISQNWEHYQEQHMVALVASGIGARMRLKQKSGLVAQVRALYDTN